MAEENDKKSLSYTATSKAIRKTTDPALAAIDTAKEVVKEVLPNPKEIANNITKIQERTKRRAEERAQNRDRTRNRDRTPDIDI